MKPASTTANFAKAETAKTCGNRRRALRMNAAVMQKTRDFFPVKTAHHLSDITGYSLRTCEYWLSEKAALPADALVALLHSERGKDFLAAVMADATPKWWLYVRAWIKRRSFEAQQRQHEREMRELLDDNFPAPSAAAMVHDPDFFGGLPSPPRKQDRPVVRRKA